MKKAEMAHRVMGPADATDRLRRGEGPSGTCVALTADAAAVIVPGNSCL